MALKARDRNELCGAEGNRKAVFSKEEKLSP